MTFKEISSDAEELLAEVIKHGGKLNIDSSWRGNLTEYVNSLLNELKVNGLCFFTSYVTGNSEIILTGEGKDYFKKKQKYEEQKEQGVISVTTGDNSIMNINTGSGQANQIVNIYTAEQNTAINEFKDKVSSSSELTAGQKEEIFELLESMEENKAKNKNVTFQLLLNRINEIVTTSNTLHAIWVGIKTLFS